MSYKTAFGVDFDLGFDLSDYPFLVDKSYHHDVCPSFYFVKNGQYYVLWVDFADPAQREDEDGPRYMIQKAENEGTEDDPDVYAGSGEVVLEFDNVIDIHRFIS